MYHSHSEEAVAASRQKPYSPAFKRQTQKLIREKFGGDPYVYIFNLTQTVDTLEENLSNINDKIIDQLLKYAA